MQPSLPLLLHTRTVLVTVDAARAVLGVDAESVVAAVDCGRLRWVWDISLRGQRRELRIWARDLIAPELSHQVDLATAIASILGTTTRETFRGAEVEHMLLCSAQHIQRLHESGELTGELVGHTRHLTRASLIRFLTQRLVH